MTIVCFGSQAITIWFRNWTRFFSCTKRMDAKLFNLCAHPDKGTLFATTPAGRGKLKPLQDKGYGEVKNFVDFCGIRHSFTKGSALYHNSSAWKEAHRRHRRVQKSGLAIRKKKILIRSMALSKTSWAAGWQEVSKKPFRFQHGCNEGPRRTQRRVTIGFCLAPR